MYIVIKTILTVIIIVTISVIARRSSFVAGILASIPLTSALAITWLYLDTKDIRSVIDLSNSILLLIPPSLIFFIVLPLTLKRLDFFYSFFISISATVLVYWVYISLLSRFDIRL